MGILVTYWSRAKIQKWSILRKLLKRLEPVIGLEPTRLAATEPKSVASTSFATPATALGRAGGACI